MGEFDNLFALGDLIIERIRNTVPGFRTIDSSSLLAGTKDITDLLPGAFIEPGFGVPPIANGDFYAGGSIDQRWEVLVTVHHWMADDPNYSAANRAGPLAWEVMRNLDNWSPDDAVFGKLQFFGQAAPTVFPGFVAFQLTFQSSLLLSINGDP